MQRTDSPAHDLFCFIAAYIRDHQRGPRLDEIREAVGLPYRSSAQLQTDKLIADGWLVKRGRSYETLQLTEQGANLARLMKVIR